MTYVGTPLLSKPKQALQLLKEMNAEFLRLQFTDILGNNKNVEVPESQFEKAVNGEIMFDGSSIEGFVRIEESDMLLKPDLETLKLLEDSNITCNPGVARIICDVYHTDETPFEGCPRLALKRQIERAAEMGYTAAFGCEAEFFLFEEDKKQRIHDHAGYFDMAPLDLGEDVRRRIVKRLINLGFEVEAAHHEVAQGQHEIDFKYADPLTTADNLATFKFVVRQEAQLFGLRATFMPKPINGVNGSGMHTHQSLFKDGENAFYDIKGDHMLSDVALSYIAGLLTYARRMCAITNPTVNSYKRLVPGFEAPTRITWSPANRSPLIRIPDKRGVSTRCELRMPDPSANPYLALAVQLAAGLTGIERELKPPLPVSHNLFDETAPNVTPRISELPRDLCEAINCFEDSEWTFDMLGEHIYTKFIEAKRQEWKEYSANVSPWEIKRYLGRM